MLDLAKDTMERVDDGRSCHITVRGAGDFTVRRGDLLLPSALEQGINYPHSCRVGTCGRCKTRLIEGRISPQIDFALSPLTNRELRDGYILACQAKVRGDLVIDVELLDHDVLQPRAIPGRIAGWQRLPGDVIDLRIALEEPLVFEAGQYAALAPSGSFVRRSFSFYDAPPGARGTTDVGFLIKRLSGGRFSEWLAAEDRRGVRMWVEAPFGQMGIDDRPVDALCIAGGTGIAPILSIAADRLRRFEEARITVIFGVRTEDSLFALERLNALSVASAGRLEVIPVLSHEPVNSTWMGERGFVTDVLATRPDRLSRAGALFICGALPMVEAVESLLREQGIAAHHIHADRFIPAGS